MRPPSLRGLVLASSATRQEILVDLPAASARAETAISVVAYAVPNPQ